MTNASARFEVATSNSLGEGPFTHNVAQYPLHYVTYAATKFVVGTSNGLGRDKFKGNETNGLTDRQTDRQTDDGQFCNKINCLDTTLAISSTWI